MQNLQDPYHMQFDTALNVPNSTIFATKYSKGSVELFKSFESLYGVKSMADFKIVFSQLFLECNTNVTIVTMIQ
jgi:hypothetical protein